MNILKAHDMHSKQHMELQRTLMDPQLLNFKNEDSLGLMSLAQDNMRMSMSEDERVHSIVSKMG